MEIATMLLEEHLNYTRNSVFLDGAVGVVAIIITALRAKLGYSDKIPMFVATFATVAMLTLSFFFIFLPTKKDVSENGICIVEGIYEHRIQKGTQGRFGTGRVYIITNDGEKLSLAMANYPNPNAFQPYLFESFPTRGPLPVRFYYTEHSNTALYMEVIEETQGYTQEAGSSVS